jgi:iron complex outermembrane recepter protein
LKSLKKALLYICCNKVAFKLFFCIFATDLHLMRTTLVILCLLSAGAAVGQNTCQVKLQGTVSGKDNGLALPFATIRIVEPPLQASTDENGRFSFSKLCPGQYTIIAALPGMKPDTVRLELSRDTVIQIRIASHAELHEVHVQGEHEHESATTVWEVSKASRAVNLGRSLAEQLTDIPGVQVLRTGASINKPVIHGLHSNRLLILNNGVRQEGQQWGYEHAPEIDPFIADEIQIIKGASSLCYGHDAMAGVILVNPKSVHTALPLYGAISTAAMSNGRGGSVSAMAGGAVPKINGLSWRLQGTLRGAGNLHSPDYYIGNTGLREQNFSWAAGYLRKRMGIDVFYSQFNTDIGIFSGSHIGNVTDLMNAIQADRPLQDADFTYKIGLPRQKIGHELVRVNSFWLLNEKVKISVNYARQFNKRQEFDLHRNNDPSIADLEFNLTTHTAQAQIEAELNKKLSIESGVFGMFQKNTWDGRLFIPNFRKQAAGLFSVLRWKISEHWLAEGGLRADYIHQQVFYWHENEILSPDYQYKGIAANMGISGEIREHWRVFVNAAHTWRPPAINEMFSNGLHHGSASLEYGDEHLGTERSINLNTGVVWQQKRFSLQTEVWAHYFNGFIYLQADSVPELTIKGAFPVFRFMQTDALLYGADLQFQWNISKKLHWLTRASVVYHHNLETGEPLPLMPSERISQRITLLWNVKNASGTLWLGVDAVNRQRFFPEGDLALPPAGYALLSAAATFQLPHNKFARGGNLVIGVNNLLNTRYRDYLDRFRYFTDQPGRNFFVTLTLPFKTNH